LGIAHRPELRETSIDRVAAAADGASGLKGDTIMKTLVVAIATLLVGASAALAEDATSVKSGKSNSSEATTVKSSKSNSSERAGAGGEANEASTLKGSKSNSSERAGAGGGGSASEATSVKSSGSNSDN
jgi:hypothetical protein